jgi:hypothetical protein
VLLQEEEEEETKEEEEAVSACVCLYAVTGRGV